MKTAEFARIRAFLAVAEHLSFSRAAETLGMTSSAVSQIVRELEAYLGQQLFQRTTRTVSLTEQGALLRERMAPLLNEMDSALLQSRDAAGRPIGTVRIVAFRSAGEKFILPALPGLRREFPEIKLDITLDDDLQDPVAAGFDLAIRIGEVIAQDMIAVPLGGELRRWRWPLRITSPAMARLIIPARSYRMNALLALAWSTAPFSLGVFRGWSMVLGHAGRQSCRQ